MNQNWDHAYESQCVWYECCGRTRNFSSTHEEDKPQTWSAIWSIVGIIFGWLCYSGLSITNGVCKWSTNRTHLLLNVRWPLRLQIEKIISETVTKQIITQNVLTFYLYECCKTLPRPSHAMLRASWDRGNSKRRNHSQNKRFTRPSKDLFTSKDRKYIDLYNKEERGLRTKSACDAARFMVKQYGSLNLDDISLGGEVQSANYICYMAAC